MGLKVVGLRKGYVKLTVPLDDNENHIGTMYAGALFTLAEIPGGAICMSTFDMDKYYSVAKEMTISFRKPAKTETTIEIMLSENEARRIESEAEIKGKAEFTLEGDLKNASGEIVAHSRGVYQLRSKQV